ncbi:MAG: HAD-IIA family hydrolase [Promethearchaeota archaeon]|jgi:HAD superfamily hydrolase (TIGR01458 family)
MEEKKNFNDIKGILTDIDGTLFFKGSAIPGAIETLSVLRKKGLKFLFLTNTDSKIPRTVLRKLNDFGFKIKEDEIYTPIIALKDYLSRYPGKKSFFVITREVEKEFQDFPRPHGLESPDFVIVGDFRDNWDVNRLNQAFKYVINGAKLLGTQGNKYFLDRDGEPVIDTGSFVQMIANAASVTPKIFGKPSKEYFLQALNILNLTHNEVLVVGDDLESDIQGAINSGIDGVLVRTGKGQYFDPEVSKIKPFKVIKSFSSLANFFE